MSLEQTQSFFAHFQAMDDSPLKQSLEEAASAQDMSAIAAIAQQAGFAVEVEDIYNYHALQAAELSDDVLARLSGGAIANPDFPDNVAANLTANSDAFL